MNTAIQEIDNKIKMFQDGLTKSFVPADEKEYYKLAIKKLEQQKQTLLAQTLAHAGHSTINFEPASRVEDGIVAPDDPKKKSVLQVLALWASHLWIVVRSLKAWLQPRRM